MMDNEYIIIDNIFLNLRWMNPYPPNAPYLQQGPGYQDKTMMQMVPPPPPPMMYAQPSPPVYYQQPPK